ncbi:MAG: cytochrome c [Alphaproteobacteria bacterium]|nr:cytochrome c [Alphaproteobacteria bacterium]
MNKSFAIAGMLLLSACDCYSNRFPGSCATEDPTSSTPADDSASCDALAAEALTVLSTHCAGCHANGRAEGGFDYLLDVDKLVELNKVRSGDPEGSALFNRMASGSMPPYGEGPSDAEIEAVRGWIACGVDAAAPERAFVPNETVFSWMAEDLRGIQEPERIYIRYISLVHLWNAGVAEGRLDTYRAGLAKLLNHLSWMPRITNPTPVDADALLYRIDLRDYRWQATTEDPVDAWETVVARDPYAFAYDDADFRFVVENTAARQPLLHADWLVAAVAVPPLYHRVLDLPARQADFLTLFGVDQAQNVADAVVDRMGFQQSGVSDNNRVIERHDADYGYCWTSYDFGGNGGAQNILADPLGFRPDGGELFCSLPNHLQAYLLANAAGDRLDVGPDHIVYDNLHDREVVNGLGCMTCHTRGILPKDDQVLPYVLDNEHLFTPQELERITLLYPPNDEGRALQAADQASFLEALDLTGAPQAYETEQVFALSEAFADDLDLARAAAEVGLTPEELEDRIPYFSDDVKRELNNLLSPGGTVQRGIFLGLAREVICVVEGAADSDGACLDVEGACGAAGVACLEGQGCVSAHEADAGACVRCAVLGGASVSLDLDGQGC